MTYAESKDTNTNQIYYTKPQTKYGKPPQAYKTAPHPIICHM